MPDTAHDTAVAATRPDHPRPLLRRDPWWSLDGDWDFALDPGRRHRHPGQVDFDRTIRVPYAPETPASGIGHDDYLAACWYRRTVAAPPGGAPDDRLVVHFGAVDHTATVWVDGVPAARHEGGYSPFEVDLTDALAARGVVELVVLAEDDPLELSKPRGKQDWERHPHSIWYPRTTGIWQGVWLERRPAVWLASLHWATSPDRVEVALEAALAGIATGPDAEDLHLNVRLHHDGRTLADDRIRVLEPRFGRGFRLDGSGMVRLRESLLWHPDHPVLIDAELELWAGGRRLDHVRSYTALRTVALADGRFVVNGRPQPLRLVLDQGYWPDTGLTPPDDDALRRDVSLTRAMGFNGVRKHQKIEDPRYLWWADRLGLFVWYEAPPTYCFDATAVRRLTAEWTAAIERDRSHPCVIAWVPFNESTGVPSLPTAADQRAFVSGLTDLTRALDPTRPVVSNDGWETVGGDVIGVHDYEQDPGRLAARWNGALHDPVGGFAAHGRRQTLDEEPDRSDPSWRPDRPVVLTEVGGIGWDPSAPMDPDWGELSDHTTERLTQPGSWGYSSVHSACELERRYRELMTALHGIEGIAGFCYTQLADTYQEVNGLLRADRTAKLPLRVIREATLGHRRTFFDPLTEL